MPGRKIAYLHIGAGKTGTSAIQSGLARNRAVLKRNGVFYPHAYGEQHARLGKISSGNAAILGKYVKAGGPEGGEVYRESAFRWLGNVTSASSENHLLLSSELLQTASKESFGELKAALESAGYECKAIYFVRHLAGFYLSVYNQAIKSKGETRTFNEYLQSLPTSYFRDTLDCISDVFGKENIICALYDNYKTDLLQFFSQLLGISDELIKPGQVNPSLGFESLQFLKYLNAKFEDQKFTNYAANSLLSLEVASESGFRIRPGELEIIQDKYSDDVCYINENYFRNDGRLEILSDDVTVEDYNELSSEELIRKYHSLTCQLLELVHEKGRAQEAKIFYFRALQKRRQGDHATAMRLCMKSLDIDNTVPSSLVLMSELYKQEGQGVLALRYLEMAYSAGLAEDAYTHSKQIINRNFFN